MSLEFRVELKANYPEDYKRKELVIGVYDTEIRDKDDEFQKIGQVNGWYYDAWAFSRNIDLHLKRLSLNQKVPNKVLTEMLLYADEMDGDAFQILEAMTDPDDSLIKGSLKGGLHSFITIDRLYVYKEYRNKGYASKILDTLSSDDFLIRTLRLDPNHTLIGLMANPFELKKEENNLDLSFENMEFLGEEDKKRLISFYRKARFKQSKLNPDVLYM